MIRNCLEENSGMKSKALNNQTEITAEYVMLTSASTRAKAINGATPPSRPMAMLKDQRYYTPSLHNWRLKSIS